jgi:hypothetical protein
MSNLNSNTSEPAYKYEVEGTVYEGMLNDERLPALLLIGMPQNVGRVRVSYSGSICGKKFADYEVEFFGIQVASMPDIKLIDGVVRYWLPGNGVEKFMHIWLIRVRWNKTKAAFEELWHPETNSWSVAIRDLHLSAKESRIRDCRALLNASELPILARKILSKTGRKPKLESEESIKLLEMAAYKLGTKGQEFEIKQLANLINVARSTLHDALKNNPQLKEILQSKYYEGRKSVFTDPLAGFKK